jgi:hypothetical protein
MSKSHPPHHFAGKLGMLPRRILFLMGNVEPFIKVSLDEQDYRKTFPPQYGPY